MKKIQKIVQDFKLNWRYFGAVKSLLSALDGLINLVAYVDCLQIMVLTRDRFPKLPSVGETGMNFRFATLADLEAMQAEGNWEINATKIDSFKQGDACLLYFMNETPSGYQWAHLAGHPEIMKNLRLALPSGYIYNYAGLTRPEFRGKKFGSHGHWTLLNHPAWKYRKGLICYTKWSNWRSVRSLASSGYVAAGTLWIVRVKGRYWVRVSPEARKFGISVASNSTHSKRAT